MTSPSRLLPKRPLPEYSYVPGLWPHPHTRGGGMDWPGEPSALRLDPARWWDCEPHLLAIDLWNHGYYWEAHEAWERVWNAAGRKGPTADFFKGLIQLAVAGVKVRQKHTESVSRHARRAGELFRGVADSMGQDLFFGLSLCGLTRMAEEIAEHPPRSPELDEAKVMVVFSETCRISPFVIGMTGSLAE